MLFLGCMIGILLWNSSSTTYIMLANSSLYPSLKFLSWHLGGCPSFALECGLPPDPIKSQVDWASDAYQRYLDPSPSRNMERLLTFSYFLKIRKKQSHIIGLQTNVTIQHIAKLRITMHQHINGTFLAALFWTNMISLVKVAVLTPHNVLQLCLLTIFL